MNIADILGVKNAPNAYLEEAGKMFVIRCIPDIFTGERINIGVCGIDKSGRRMVRAIQDPGRLTCLYGESASNVVLLAQVAADAAQSGHPSPSTQIIFDEPTPYYNSSLEDLVLTTFKDQVTVALPQRENNRRLQIDDDRALEQVSDVLKLSKQLDFDILANTPQVIVNTDRGPRTIKIPLQPRNGVGTIRSADYSPQIVKNHLMDSVLDMECAARYRQKRHMGLFILRPTTGNRSIDKQIDAVIDSIAYRAPSMLHLDVAQDEKALSKHVQEWAMIAQD